MFDNQMLPPHDLGRTVRDSPRDVLASGTPTPRNLSHADLLASVAADIVRDLISDTRRNLTHLADLRAAHIEAFRSLEAMHAEILNNLDALLEFIPCACSECAA